MTTLRIEHAIHDYDQWKAAFDGFAQVRLNAGVRGHAIRRQVWSSTDSAPALAGVPRTRFLELRATDWGTAAPGETD
jgi:hypothetical protein